MLGKRHIDMSRMKQAVLRKEHEGRNFIGGHPDMTSALRFSVELSQFLFPFLVKFPFLQKEL